MKATEQYVPVVVYCTVQAGSNFRVVGRNPNMTIQMKATEHNFLGGAI